MGGSQYRLDLIRLFSGDRAGCLWLLALLLGGAAAPVTTLTVVPGSVFSLLGTLPSRILIVPASSVVSAFNHRALSSLVMAFLMVYQKI